MSIDKQVLKNQINMILDNLNKAAPLDQYQLLSSHNMFGLHTLLLAKQSIHSRIDKVMTAQSSKGQ